MCVVLRGLEAALLQEFSVRNYGFSLDREFIVASAFCAHERDFPPETLQTLARCCRKEGLGLLVGCNANVYNEVSGSKDTNGCGIGPFVLPN